MEKAPKLEGMDLDERLNILGEISAPITAFAIGPNHRVEVQRLVCDGYDSRPGTMFRNENWHDCATLSCIMAASFTKR